MHVESVLWSFSCIQLEMEMDFILDKKDVISDAVHNWKTTWVPAIHSYAETLTGKQRSDFRQSRETLRGVVTLSLQIYTRRQ